MHKGVTPLPPQKLVYICDWLPPDYGAVGQYSLLFAREMAQEGMDITLAGLTTGEPSDVRHSVGRGSLRIIKLKAKPADKGRLIKRLLWTAKINTRLVVRLWRIMRKADSILFTGSPPLLLHWIAPANLLLRKRLIYRITDFHPECQMAASPKISFGMKLFYRLTLFWRRRVHQFEVLGEDQRARLAEIRIQPARVRLKRDPSPVAIPPATRPLPRPQAYRDKHLLLYSGNWGVVHDVATFIEAYRRHHTQGSKRFVLWLNAMGANADVVEKSLREQDLPVIRTLPVPLDGLASLLVTPAAHLVTLSDAFVGFVLPSKIYGCIASNKPVLFIGSAKSDVHLLSAEHLGNAYRRVDVGDAQSGWRALEEMADAIEQEANVAKAS